MLSPSQTQIVYLMFLNGLLFLGLNFIAHAIVFPAPIKSKRIGYVLITLVFLTFIVTQENQILTRLDFTTEMTQKILLGGFVAPTFFLSLVYYRIKRSREERQKPAQ